MVNYLILLNFSGNITRVKLSRLILKKGQKTICFIAREA